MKLAHRFIFLCFVFSIEFTAAQTIDLDPEKWAKELNKKGKDGNESYRTIDSILENTKNARPLDFINKLADKGTKDYHFQARFNCLKAHQTCLVGFFKDNIITPEGLARKGEIKAMLDFAMDQAYRSEDDHVIALTSTWYGQLMIHFGEIGVALMYSMNGLDLSEKLSERIRPYDYQFLAEMLYKVREYNSSIKYARKAVNAWKTSNQDGSTGLLISSLNTVALGYHRQDKYDTAFYYYDQALQLAKETNRPIWIGIVSANMAQIYYMQKKYDIAYPIFINDYRTSKDSGYYDNAANSLQWAARTNLALGNKELALKEVREAFQLLKIWPAAAYLRNVYYTQVQIFREMKAYDSAFYYNNLYVTLNDSLERIVSTSSTEISKARLNDEASKYNIQRLNKEKKEQVTLRNMIIGAIVLVSLIIILIVNRTRLKTKMRMEKAEQEVNFARDQLKMFTESIIEKTNLIEKLEMQVKGKESTSEQQAIISELSQQTILTEDDWQKFKSLFEKIYPGFFMKLKEKLPEITLAEQRMAALTRLHLNTKQIASMLGISADSVHKSRYRLRQRFNVGTEGNLDELVATI